MSTLTKFRAIALLLIAAVLYVAIQTQRGFNVEAALIMFSDHVTALALVVIAFLLFDLRARSVGQ